MGNTLAIVGFCYFCGYEGKGYPRYCRKYKGDPCWEAYKQGKKDKQQGKESKLPPIEMEKHRKFLF